MNELQKAGAASKPTRYAPIHLNRFFGGLWTQRNPLRDAASTRYEEKFLGARGDALISGLNTELTNRLTLARRPGLSVFNSADIGAVYSFYPFRYYNGTQEVIKVMADTASTVYDATTTNTTVYTKSTGAGASIFKSIGNTLFWGDGVDQKKWLTSAPWSANTTYTTGQFIVDPNNNVQEAVAPTGLWAVSTAYTVGQYVVDNNGNIQQVTTAGTSGTSQPAWAVTLGATTDDGTGTLVWTCMGDSGTSGSTQPTWSTTYGTIVSDGTVNWMCMGSAVQNWGVAFPPSAPTNQASAYAGSDCRYWSPNTSTTAGYTVLDPNGFIQLMSTFAPVGGQTLTPAVVSNGTPDYNAYNNTAAATDGDPTTFAYIIMQHIDRSGSCVWGFNTYSGSTPPICRINVLSEIPYNGEVYPGVDRTYADDGNYNDTNRAVIVTNDNAQLSYSIDGGSTWTNIYSAGGGGVGRAKQWDTVTLPTGTNPASVQIMATTNAHDDMCHYIYEVNMVIEEDIGVSGGALTTGSSVPKWSTTLYGVTNDGNAHWINCGTISSWQANTLYTYTGPTASIVDINGNLQVLQNTGTSGTTAPTWALTPGSTTTDGGLTWLNCGSGTVAAYSGWTYVYAYHCVDGHVSTASSASYSTGPVMGNIDVPLSGVGSSDTQVDAVWLFRTVDGGSTFLFMDEIPNPGVNGKWNLKDTNPDSTLNLFIQAAIDDANDPPPVGSVAPEYHLGRVWVAVGNTVYYSQSYTSVGVAVQSFPPLNYFIFPSIVTRMVSTPSGLLVFTVSDVFVILGTGIDSIFYVTDFIDGVGLLHYHALAVNGSTPMLLTSDGQFLAITTDGGVSELGFPIGDLLEGFNPATAYVSWHVDGSKDKAIYVSDGATGWYRCNPTSTPETGLVWSPFAALTGGCSAVQSIEISPGVHKLLVGSSSTGEAILKRDLTVSSDNGTPYSANAIIGSIVLAYPGQLAEVVFLTYDAPCIPGANLPILGVILDEALPYYTGEFTSLDTVVNDPPLLPPSSSLSSKRAYLSQSQLPAWCRSMQIQVDFGADAYPEELLSLTVFGGVHVEL